jgi:hypothetical protein
LADAVTDRMAFEISNRNSNVVAYTVTDSFTDSFTNTIPDTVANQMAIKVTDGNSDFMANAFPNRMANETAIGGNVANTTTFVANETTIRYAMAFGEKDRSTDKR